MKKTVVSPKKVKNTKLGGARKLKNPDFIEREGYSLNFVKPADEAKLNELRNSGKVIGEINFDSKLPGEQGNEIVIATRN